MLYRLLKSVLVITLLFTFQISAKTSQDSYVVKKLSVSNNTSDLKKSTPPFNIYAEAGVNIHLPAIKSSAHTADVFLTTCNFNILKSAACLYSGRRSSVFIYRFYRLILFPFHGFW
ncbi:hypothetical protein SNE25_22445 [Mucilaginibacter sabulilitoris]|uniref:Uncharacterized protein n=1 Tax=Mucilaginibacter sabulilitoris TaxID=1173583 RepID=A0ABZ0TFX3_9SPHI|nr:hypothetical protein [Mucilaginibacter sabulilitoris]WPU92084.1 hypothetical protein SNE25_22445 [Mucilaginibacter sabulilitoris]